MNPVKFFPRTRGEYKMPIWLAVSVFVVMAYAISLDRGWIKPISEYLRAFSSSQEIRPAIPRLGEKAV